ncbi:hypothetical protein C1Y11_01275 [Pseudomonas sp. FW305-20]|nr:hypothetical protein C1Y11_01275 [Pseudomonas sp. FW305-20]PMU22235.1 hypothetical protein C1Y10_00250 [Pseudomonas sp. FW305-122]PMU43439.1 hypothetical protein C1Y12_01450 [Pseudomonas sp. FW305-47B]PMX57749.1 hypothetical protein C1Y13_23225 [Pseudomonas sp. FW305-33]PMX64703.1 hypothetical protein C1X12_20435 [Pseudomonas sp. FW305-60]
MPTDLNPCAVPVGASLLAMAAEQSISMLNEQPLSRASSLPQVSRCPSELCWDYLMGEKSAAISSFDSIFSSIGNAFGTKPSSQSGS